MVEVGKFVDGLKAAGVELFAGVPDSLEKSFCTYVTDTCVVEKSHSTTSTPPMGSDSLSSPNGVRPFAPLTIGHTSAPH